MSSLYNLQFQYLRLLTIFLSNVCTMTRSNVHTYMNVQISCILSLKGNIRSVRDDLFAF